MIQNIELYMINFVTKFNGLGLQGNDLHLGDTPLSLSPKEIIFLISSRNNMFELSIILNEIAMSMESILGVQTTFLLIREPYVYLNRLLDISMEQSLWIKLDEHEIRLSLSMLPVSDQLRVMRDAESKLIGYNEYFSGWDKV